MAVAPAYPTTRLWVRLATKNAIVAGHRLLPTPRSTQHAQAARYPANSETSQLSSTALIPRQTAADSATLRCAFFFSILETIKLQNKRSHRKQARRAGAPAHFPRTVSFCEQRRKHHHNSTRQRRLHIEHRDRVRVGTNVFCYELHGMQSLSRPEALPAVR